MEIRPKTLRDNDVVCIISPASVPEQSAVARQVSILESWKLRVELGKHIYAKQGYFAGSDYERAADFNEAVRDPSVRAIMASRGGKGSYRLLDLIDYNALAADPKYLIGFSDITALHFAAWNRCRLVGLHGGLVADELGRVHGDTSRSLQHWLLGEGARILAARQGEATSLLTTTGVAKGRLIGGNLSIMGTSAEWLLPKLQGAIVFLEALDTGPGPIDRTLQMLKKSGSLNGIAGVAVGQFGDAGSCLADRTLDLLQEHLRELDVPILGGLPIGHGRAPQTVPLGRMVRLDAENRILEFLP